MKDIVIKWKWVRRELLMILACYLLANLANLASIIFYKTSWSELYSAQEYVLYLTEWFYIISVAVRLLYYGVRRIL